MSDRRVLAVDGGNSKTDVAILDETGRVLGTHRGPGASFTPDDHDRSVADLERSVLAAAADAGIDARPVADAGVFCLAGADLPADDRRILRAVRGLGLVAEPVLRNDTFAVMRAGAPRGWGVAVVCGAGFNCTGVGPDGREVRFPALGAISGDWAGGATIGIEAVGACVRAGDGRGPRTELERAVPAHFGLKTPRQVMVGLHTGKLDDSRVYELAPVVLGAANAGDPVAVGIVERQAEEVSVLVCTSLRRLRLLRTEADVVLGGGVARARSPVFMRRLTERVSACAPKARIAVVDDLPIVGAALLALDQLAVADGAGAHLRETLVADRFARNGAVP
ncbi:MAG TPA: BadF/BadG/BcrA/BcrD ATPase family protein [Gaiellales bacterium]|jgi:N-acetylglucosamine kinase-like BadF-type ATPase